MFGTVRVHNGLVPVSLLFERDLAWFGCHRRGGVAEVLTRLLWFEAAF